jgi:uncharacterized repeat protein (TIGR01451 family)
MDRKLLKLILFFSIFNFQFSIFNKPARASWYCEPVYGGGERCWGTGEILIDKAVKNPSTGLFVDNLGVNDPKYAPGQEVLYRLEVKNTGQGTFSKVTIKDIFPPYLDFVWGPLGWNSETRTLQFDIYDLKAGESRQFEVMAKVFDKERLPDDRSLICVVNTSSVEADGKTDSDQAQICFEKKVLGVQVLPPTGVNIWTLSLGLLVTTIFGAKLAFAQRKAL